MGSYTIERFGSVHPRVQPNCGLGNTISGHELEWISVNGLLVASRPIKFNISWDWSMERRSSSTASPISAGW